MLRKTELVHVANHEFAESDYADIERLYRKLYVGKYTPLNPQYTNRFVSEMHKSGLLRLFGLRAKNGSLVGVSALSQIGQVLTQPIVGYDTSLPQKLGLYRMLMAHAYETAQREKLTLNISAGASRFKRNRGFHTTIEYTAVYADHLSRRRRIALKILEHTLTWFGVPLLKRFDA